MSNIDNKMFEITSANQNLFIDLDEKDGETVSGGCEVFTVKNQTNYNVRYKNYLSPDLQNLVRGRSLCQVAIAR